MVVKLITIVGSVSKGVSHEFMLAMLEVRLDISFLVFSLTLSREMRRVSQSWLWVWVIGVGGSAQKKKNVLDNGTTTIIAKRVSQWDRFQIRVPERG
jgi:hypothetical protein